MKAVVLTEFGSADNLVLQDLDLPELGPHDVLVKVHATSVNPADIGLRQGMFGALKAPPLVLGFDVAGVVTKVGSSVSTVHVGDDVYYGVDLLSPRAGGNAEYHVSHEAAVTLKPRNMNFAEAAAVPIAGGTAYVALFRSLKLHLGQSILIHGAAGGVGTYAVQLAKATGAFVIASCGGYDLELVLSLGADVVVDYAREDVVERTRDATEGAGVHAVLDASGGKMAAASIPITKENGRIATVTGVQGDLNPAMRNNISVHFVHLSETKTQLEHLRTLIEREQIKSVVGAKYPLEQVADAHKVVEQGGSAVHGKVVVTVT
jgi:NADPH:quinone reductase-like Zn-dependent oxidoreductase